MQEEQKKLWQVQLMRYFITHKDYIRVKFLNFSRNKQEEDSQAIWLINQNNTDYMIIRITPSFTNSQFQEGIVSLQNTIKKTGRVLDISLNENDIPSKEENINHVVITDQQISDPDLLKKFDGIELVVSCSGEPEKEMARVNQQIVDYALKKQIKRPGLWESFKSRSSLVFWVIGGICALVYALQVLCTGILGVSSTSSAIACGAYYKAFLTILNQWPRLLTAGFVHGSIWHLLMNMMSLYDLSKIMTEAYGKGKTFLILLVSVIVGNLCVYAGDGNIVAVGLSGGLYGLLAAVIIFYWQNGYFKLPAVRSRFYSLLTVNILISMMPNVSFLAHVGGFICGCFLGLILSKSAAKSMKINCAICLVISLLTVGYFGYRNSEITEPYWGTDCEVAAIYDNLGLHTYAEKIISETYIYYIERGN